ncbi:membrane-associated HD superfamily phosphohydrolase [Staphylococcus epidermidis]|uniref:DUF5079 family protein n=1 Tax=Staphylococcus epidermidis TaxID=1282 RepID=UPI00039E722A|nr:DUF5079 family protein [Staphylococcus epidermidis]KEI47626.1 membrane protein [Staphylococcus epidermidis UC7032]MBM0828980.1 DUF5079 family protein [Staphylococcus epidermidis]MBM0846678.1 DUF5079 family protein [Staphylococcus epidermidis]MCG1130759.1 DUF5079 family protein [Staphylococcus epidermidis]MCG1615324.1 DUF5079 family protein [Staphylococcus epidermidis]
MDKENLQVLSINNIKNSYLIGFALVNFIIFAFYIFLYCFIGMEGTVPNYMKIYLAISLLLWLILYLQEKGKILADFNRNNYKKRVCIYMLINILAGYNIPFLISSADIFYYSGVDGEAFKYWIIIASIILISMTGLFIFCYSEFEMFGNKQYIVLKISGVFLILLSFITLIYISFISPSDSGKSIVIWVGCFFLFGVHIIMGRVYFYLAVLMNDIREDGLKL